VKELLDKLSSYNLFNYLLPGVVFVALAQKLTKYSFTQNDLVLAAFAYYFIGLVISRLGSLFIEPFLKWLKFVEFADYKDFVDASKIDPKIEILSEANNSYRTLTALIAALLILKVYEQAGRFFPWISSFSMVIVLFLLLLMFLFSYRKQTAYIVKRIKATLKR
jgi:uncharacterized Tic20 family protein